MRSIHRFGALGALLATVMPLAWAGVPTGADLGVSKSAPATAAADSGIAYTLVIANAGPDPAIDAQLSDALPAELTFVSLTQDNGPPFACTDPGAGNPGTVTCIGASLPTGQSAQFTLTAHIDALAAPGTVITNIANVDSITFDPNEENDIASAATSLPAPQSDLRVHKLAAEGAGADQPLVYSITVGNSGPDAATGFLWQDTLPGDLTFVALQQLSGPLMNCTTPAIGTGGTVTCTLASFASGASAEFELTAQVPAGTPSGIAYSNTVTVSSETADPNEVNNASTVTTTISAIDLSATKTGPASVVAGGTVTYQLGISNAGPDTADSADLVDALPAPLTFVSLQQDSGPPFVCATPGVGANGSVSCSSTAFAAGATAQFTLVAQVPIDTPDGTSLVNTATAATLQHDVDTADNSASVTTGVTNTADVGVAKTAPATANAGDNLVYTLVVSNSGPDAASGVALSDTLPAGTTFVSLAQTGAAFGCTTPAVGAAGTVTCTAASLASAATATLTLTVQVSEANADGAVIVNTAGVSSTSTDANAANDTATASTTVVNQADLALTKTGQASATAGGTLVYTLGLVNNGPSTAASVTLSDPLPADTTFVSLTQTGAALACTTPAVGAAGSVTCTAASLASGATTTLTLTVQVSEANAHGAVIVNTASVSSTSTDPDAANDTATASTTVVNQANLALTKTGPASATAGGTLVYTLGLVNNGPSSAASVTLSDPLPADTTFVSLTQTGTALACTTPAVGAAGTVTCTGADYADAATTTLTLTLQVSDAVPNPFSITNTATVTTASDPNPADNTATTTANGTNTADLGVTKTAPATAIAGGTLAYTLGVANAGPLADSATLFDALPAGTTFVSLAQDAGPAFACTTPAVGATGSVSCTNAAFASGASASFTLTVRVDASNVDGTTIGNTATIDGTRADPAPANDTATANTTISNLPNLVLAKSAPERVDPGTTIAYVLELANSGNAPALGVVLSDALPLNTRFSTLVQDSGPAFACTTPAVGANGTVSCSIAALEAGASARFTLTVSVPIDFNGVVDNTASATTTSADAVPADNASTAGTLVGFAASGAPLTIPTLSWFGLLALAAAIGLLGAAMTLRAR